MYSGIGEIKHDLHFIYIIVLIYVVLFVFALLFVAIFFLSAASEASSLYSYR